MTKHGVERTYEPSEFHELSDEEADDTFDENENLEKVLQKGARKEKEAPKDRQVLQFINSKDLALFKCLGGVAVSSAAARGSDEVAKSSTADGPN